MSAGPFGLVLILVGVLLLVAGVRGRGLKLVAAVNTGKAG